MAQIILGVIWTGVVVLTVTATMISMALQAGTEFVKTLLYPLL